MRKYGILDLFCGTGGFSTGFAKLDNRFELVGGIDILETSTKTFELNNPNAVVITGDIRKIKPSDFDVLLCNNNKSVDLIVGGPPCQGFSSIRPFRNTNEDDSRNTLFENFVLYVNYFRPKIFVMENVVGLATHKNGETIETISECFEQIGYSSDWKILNTANYGIPQKRERLILIGYREHANVLFPEPTHYFSGKTIGIYDKKRIVDANPNDKTLRPAVSIMDSISDLPPVKSGENADKYLAEPRTEYEKDRRKNMVNDDLSLHSATNHSKKMLEIISHSGANISHIPKHLINSGFSSSYSRLEADEPSNTLTVNFVHPASNKCIHPTQDRALTPREGARIQSFDDNFKFYGSRTQIVKQIGNAVPPLLGLAIAKAILPELVKV